MPLDDKVVDNATPDLAARWHAYRTAHPGVRIRDAAAALRVSEAELVATGCGTSVRRLRPDWQALLDGVPPLGRVMALSRNENAVHERHGSYAPADITGNSGLVLGAEIDLRLFLDRWAHGFAVSDATPRAVRRSLQVFASCGTAIHKIYATERTDMAAWRALVENLLHADQSTALEVIPAPRRAADRPDSAIDVAGLLEGWRALQDVHEFRGLLRRHGVGVVQAFRLARSIFTERLDTRALPEMLTQAAADRLPIMVFVGNPGIIQIHTGPVQRIERRGPWLNVLDPDFNLHLREDRIASVWLVRKPTRDGTVSSLEAFDASGGRIASFFGKRKPGERELAGWRRILSRLPRFGVRQ